MRFFCAHTHRFILLPNRKKLSEPMQICSLSPQWTVISANGFSYHVHQSCVNFTYLQLFFRLYCSLYKRCAVMSERIKYKTNSLTIEQNKVTFNLRYVVIIRLYRVKRQENCTINIIIWCVNWDKQLLSQSPGALMKKKNMMIYIMKVSSRRCVLISILWTKTMYV